MHKLRQRHRPETRRLGWIVAIALGWPVAVARPGDEAAPRPADERAHYSVTWSEATFPDARVVAGLREAGD